MQRKGAFDYILLETTGLADPGESYLSALIFVRRRVPRSNSVHLLAQ
jgi:G3E family GTPase